MKKQKTRKLKLSWDPEKEDSEQYDEVVQKLAQCLFPEPEDNELSKREYAAIHLRVPMSGADWLDDMIRASLESSNKVEDNPQGAPDWSDAPSWAEWLAQDSDGWWYWYEVKPRILHLCWIVMGGKHISAKKSIQGDNWKNTLQKRLETK